MTLASILYKTILYPLVLIIEASYLLFSRLFDNTGIAVLGVSFTVTLLCLPLYIVAENWQDLERNIQTKLKPGVDRIKAVFKGDEQYMILSTYYRQNHYHPIMALRSSFGILIQIPFFLAAYHTLSSLPELQGQSFLFIRDMGKPDAIFTLGNFNVNILPVLMTLINCVSGAIYSKGHGLREKIQIYGMAVLFLIVLYNSPAGLVVYWTMNNILSLVKNVFYKMKNPLKVLYAIMCAVFVFLAFYILFLYSGSASFKKRLPASLALLLCIPVPLYLKAVNLLLQSPLKNLTQNKKLRFSIFIFSGIAICVMTGLVLPSSMIASSVQEFSNIENYTNPIGFLASSFWISFGFIIFWPSCIYFLFGKKIQSLISFAYLFLLIACIINAYAFAGNYGSIDPTLKFVDGLKNPSSVYMLANIAVLIFALAALLALFHFRLDKILSRVSVILSFAFVIFAVVNAVKINSDYTQFAEIEQKNAGNGDKTKIHLSKSEKNVLVIMLDRFESAHIPFILKDFPEFKEKLRGFVYYPNTISASAHTLMGSPGVYGGYEYTPYEMNKHPELPLKEKHNQALLMLPEIFTKQAGFEAYISDLSWGNYSYLSDMSFAQGIPDVNPLSLRMHYTAEFKKECMKPGFEKASLSHTLNRNLFWVSLFRQSPTALRPVVYYKSTWWENGINETADSFADWYATLYKLTDITKLDSKKPALLVMTTEAPHSNEDISMFSFKELPKIENSSSLSIKHDNSYKINTVVLNKVLNFIDFLRSNDAFDNTRIILVSDHANGSNPSPQNYDKDKIDGYTKDLLNCVLLVKDFNSNDELKTDKTFMTNADVPTLALKDIVKNPVNPFTGSRVSSDYKEKNGLFVTTEALFMPYHSKSRNVFTVSPDSWYNVKDNIFIDENWKQIK